MISSAEKFFRDNLTRVSPLSNPLEHNLNQGLLTLTHELHREVRRLHEEMEELKRKINNLR